MNTPEKNGGRMFLKNKLNVVCWKWTGREADRKRVAYDAEYVNIFANMIDRNLNLPYEIICVTDDPTGIDGGVKTVQLWEDGLDYGYCFVRLKAFSEEMVDILGPRFVSMDLDCVIINDITPLFDHNNDFMIWERNNKLAPYCGSMWMMDAGARKHIWHDFKFDDMMVVTHCQHGKRYTNKHAYKAGFTVGSDQAWMNYKMYPKEKTWTKEDGVLNFRQDVYQKFRTFKEKNAKIIYFSGRYDPSSPQLQEEYPWIKENWR